MKAPGRRDRPIAHGVSGGNRLVAVTSPGGAKEFAVYLTETQRDSAHVHPHLCTARFGEENQQSGLWFHYFSNLRTSYEV